MAFNFNWSPLAADASFYIRAQELLTAALNKSPKPPIIVDDILVNEFNLGSVPPDVEILEIGDLAEDRFRGIFKMCYSGDAFLTLKTRVQANPLNTYLSTKPSFASPQPLAAASGLTIPLQITLSEIRLSAFIILVFSKQKGLTLVFRNDPLESLKVSSTFDSIPFVREYLQKEIEGQLRTLLMDEVPAIIHRLSLRLWVSEYRAREDEELTKDVDNLVPEEKVIDPLAGPPLDPVDLSGHILDAAQIASLSLESGSETHSLFSQKNLLRLGALTNSHRTLSLFTPSIRDVFFRAWAGPTERGEHFGSNSLATPALSRSHSYNGSTSTTYVFSDGTEGSQFSRPMLSSCASAATGLGLRSSKHGKSRGGRKRKHRVINLRKKSPTNNDLESVSGEGSTISGTMSSAPSEYGMPLQVAEEREELVTPPRSPDKPVSRRDLNSIDLGDTPPRLRTFSPQSEVRMEANDLTPRPPMPSTPAEGASSPTRQMSNQHALQPGPSIQLPQYPVEKLQLPPSSSRSLAQPQSQPDSASFAYLDSHAPSGILEQAWLVKIAGEIARKVQDEKTANSGFWDHSERHEGPPPAYGS
ncbi:ERMES complex subunit [Pseudocyphellaria aurata]|nr:ERMES complex subunit [Pseudocyphellaria aurata]